MRQIMRFLKAILPVLTAGLFAAGISILLNSEPVRATLFTWSKTAASNSTADATINWAEGMAPSAVNDSARAMMASVAKYRDDTSGSLVTGGTSTAFTLTSNQVFSSLANMSGSELCFRMNATSGASPTLNVDTLGAKALNSVSGTAIPSGALISGGVYCAVYVNASNEWLVKGATGATIGAPAGTILLAGNSSCPSGWTKGSSLNDYAVRVVTGTPTNGGTVAFSTLYARTGTDAVTLAQGNIPNYNLSIAGLSVGITDTHTHGYASPLIGGGGFSYQAGGSIAGGITSTSGTNTGSITAALSGTLPSGGTGTSFTPAIDMRVKFLDMVLCTKD